LWMNKFKRFLSLLKQRLGLNKNLNNNNNKMKNKKIIPFNFSV